MKEELDEQKYITVKERLSLTEEIKKAENKNYYIGYEKAQEESKIKIQELEKELNEYKDQHSHLQKLAHSDL